MNQNNSNSLQYVRTTFYGYAVPIQGIGTADHTCVYGLSSANQSEFTCCGIQRAIPPVPPLAVAQGGLIEVIAMVNGSTAQKNPPIYDDFHLDSCGITYAVSGVCHQIANRILFTGGTSAYNPFTLPSVRGLTLSTAIYGIFGRTRIPMMSRLITSIQLATASGIGAKRTYDDPENIREKIIDKLCDSKELTSEFRLMILDELYNSSNMLDRVHTILSHKLGSEFTEDLKRSIRNAVDELDIYMDILYQDNEAGKITVNNSLITEINGKVQRFDNSLHNSLGAKNYKKVFGYDYDADFLLCEPLLDSE